MHLVGFIARNFTMYGHMNVKFAVRLRRVVVVGRNRFFDVYR